MQVDDSCKGEAIEVRSKTVELFMQAGTTVIIPKLIQEIEGQSVCFHKTIINWVLMYGYRGWRHTERFIECNIYLTPKELKQVFS